MATQGSPKTFQIKTKRENEGSTP